MPEDRNTSNKWDSLPSSRRVVGATSPDDNGRVRRNDDRLTTFIDRMTVVHTVRVFRKLLTSSARLDKHLPIFGAVDHPVSNWSTTKFACLSGDCRRRHVGRRWLHLTQYAWSKQAVAAAAETAIGQAICDKWTTYTYELGGVCMCVCVCVCA